MSEQWKTLDWPIDGKQLSATTVLEFRYTAGANRLDVKSVELLDGDQSVAKDEHAGRAGIRNAANRYVLKLATNPSAKPYTLRATIRSDAGTDSTGEVSVVRASRQAASSRHEPGRSRQLPCDDEADWADLQSRLQILLLSRKTAALRQRREVEDERRSARTVRSPIHRGAGGGLRDVAWQGGEPTLLGVDYFRHVVSLQTRYANGKRIENALQTNGTLLDDDWCDFFARNQFLIGLSVDGPRRMHDHYRVDKRQQPTFDAVMRGLALLKKHRVEFNTLTVVNRVNSQHPLEVYRFFKEIGSGYLQFIPLVERLPQTRVRDLGLDFAEPPVQGEADEESPVTNWSLRSADFGRFLTTIFDEWVRHDVGRTFVQMFDVALGQWMGHGATLCVFAETCGKAMALEHNGDLYSRDHYVYPRYKLGNLMNTSLGEMARSVEQRKFGHDKSATLPQYCRQCEVRFACNGECPKHRFITTPDGEAGLNYLCAGYRQFFNYIDPYMKTMSQLLRGGQSAAGIMPMLARRETRVSSGNRGNVGRNASCPCGSGRKFKRCCGAASEG